jgi:hypothetical protein
MAAQTCARADNPDLTRITRVVQQLQPAQANATYVHSLSQRRLTKFVDDDTSGTLRFDVEWQTSKAGCPPGAVVVLDYRLGKSLQTRSIRSSTDCPAKGKRTTTFYVQLPSGEPAGGTDLPWRARILLNTKVLAQRQSTLWR